MNRQQINMRLTDELAREIDRKRIELQSEMGRIPGRSEVLRLALEAYLGTGPGPTEDGVDRRSE